MALFSLHVVRTSKCLHKSLTLNSRTTLNHTKPSTDGETDFKNPISQVFNISSNLWKNLLETTQQNG